MGASILDRIWLGQGLQTTATFGEEPGPFVGLVYPVFQQACSGNVTCLVTKRMKLAHSLCQRRIVVPEFRQHVERLEAFGRPHWDHPYRRQR